MTLGKRVFDEMFSRGALLGCFKFADYQRLKRIDDAAELKRFFNDRGLTVPADCGDPVAVVDGLCSANAELAKQAVGCWLITEAVWCLLYLLALCGC